MSAVSQDVVNVAESGSESTEPRAQENEELSDTTEP